MEESPQQLLSGDVVADRFRVIRMLGRGGYGEVYLAEQVSVGRNVALKILHQATGIDPRVAKRFDLEARQTSKLQHPNTVVIHDFGQDQARGLFFLAMEYLEGDSLKAYITREGTLSIETTMHIVEQVAGSLQEAHDNGLIHRDLKPANVMLAPRAGDDLFVKVIDFGIAKTVQDEGPRLTDTGVLVGTPFYMAPELAGSGQLDGRVDLYSLGVMTFQMLTGDVPFRGTSAIEVLKKHLMEAPPSLFDVNPRIQVPGAVDRWLQQTLSKAPEDRPATMREFVTGLRRTLIVDEGPTILSSMEALDALPAVKVGGAPLEAHGRATEAELPPSSAAPAAPHAGPRVATTHMSAVGGKRTPWVLIGAIVGLLVAIVVVVVMVTAGNDSDGSGGADTSQAESPESEPEIAVAEAAGEATETPLSAETDNAQPESGAIDAPQANASPADEADDEPADEADEPAANDGSPAEVDDEPLADANDGADDKPPAKADDEPPAKADDEPPAKADDEASAEGDDSKPTDSPRSRGDSIECKVSVRPWGDAQLNGKAMKQRGSTAYFKGKRGKSYKLQLLQDGNAVRSLSFEVPSSGACSVKLQAR